MPEAGDEGNEELILETATDCNGPTLSPSLSEMLFAYMGQEQPSIPLGNSATYFGPYSHPMSSYHFENIQNFMPKI